LQPKRFQRLTRFRSVLEALGRGRGQTLEDRLLTGAPLARPDWADLAAIHGYADQSHLHAEFTAFSGLTPGAYSAQFRGHTNHLPVDP
jgi:AraC-like DNA-binding protein